MVFFWGTTIVCACISAFIILLTMAGAKGAPQEAAGYAMACALTIVPYVFTRALAACTTPKPNPDADRIVKAIEKLGQQDAA